MKDETMTEIVHLLDVVTEHGANVVACVEASFINNAEQVTATPASWGPATTSKGPTATNDYKKFTNNASYEARRLKNLFLTLYQ